MSTGDVFQPSQGPLILPTAITTGARESMDNYKKSSINMSRPSTNGGYRFGHLSHNSFFARHNPHPGRVRHIKGLLDVPICAVNDNGFLSNSRYAPSFPPNSYANNQLARHAKVYNIPANSVNVNSQLHPINTITGLQYFLGKPMNMRIFRERMNTRNVANGGGNEVWHDELKALTEALGLESPPQFAVTPQKPATAASRPRTQYSESTGRLLPPPSRAMSRGGPGGSRMGGRDAMTAIGARGEPDTDDMVLGLLAQILQTDDMSAVQQWLVSAGDREKSMVLDLIRQAMEARNISDHSTAAAAMAAQVPDDYSAPLPEPKFDDTDIIGDADLNDKIDRLTLEPPTPPRSQQNGRPRSKLSRPNSRQQQQQQQQSSTSPAEPVSMRYTFTPSQQGQPPKQTFSYGIPEEDENQQCSAGNVGVSVPAVTFSSSAAPADSPRGLPPPNIH